MFDAIELLFLSLALTLGAIAFALGATLVRTAWRDAVAGLPSPGTLPAGPGKPLAAVRGIAAFEALKAMLALAAAWGVLAFAAHPDWVRASSAIFSHLGLTAGGQQASGALAHWLAVERGPMLLGVAGYALLHLAEAWGLWHVRPWGETLGVASGSIYLPFEVGHLLHRPGWSSLALLVLNLAVVAYLVGRLRRRFKRTGNAGVPVHQSA